VNVGGRSKVKYGSNIKKSGDHHRGGLSVQTGRGVMKVSWERDEGLSEGGAADSVTSVEGRRSKSGGTWDKGKRYEGSGRGCLFGEGTAQDSWF